MYVVSEYEFTWVPSLTLGFLRIALGAGAL